MQAGRYEPAAAEKVAAGQHQMVFPPPPNGAAPISVPSLLQPQVVLEVALILSYKGVIDCHPLLQSADVKAWF